MKPTVSVLCVNWNTSNLLERCLNSLDDAEQSGYLETIVVDNGSTDGSVAMVRRRGGHHLIVNHSNVGFTAATNQAFDVSSAPYVLMLNSDTVVLPGSISACVRYIEEHQEVAAVGCRLLNEDGSHQNSIFRFPSIRGVLLTTCYLSQAFPNSQRLNWDRYGNPDVDEPTSVDVVMGSFLLIDRRYLNARALLDEGYFMFGEETDLCRRLHEAGGSVVHLPGPSVVHSHGASSKSAAQQAWKKMANRRGVLRYLRLWRPSGVAEAANLIMLSGLASRYLALGAIDLLDRGLGRPPQRRRARSGPIAFHLRAVVRPWVMDSKWGPPPEAQQ